MNTNKPETVCETFHEPGQAIAEVRRITWVGIAINVVLTCFKLIAGIVGSSQAVVADAVHSFSDLSTDFAIIFGVKYWTAPADGNHPYGHGRIETIITAAIGIILAVVGIGIGYNSIVTVRDADIHQPGWIAFIAALVSIISKEWLYRWTVQKGQQLQSSAVVANAWHHRSDALSSIPVAVAVIIAIISRQWSFVDHIGAIIVSIFILHAAWGITTSALSELSDIGVSKDVCDAIETIVLKNTNVREVHAIRARRSGPGIFVDLHILVDPQMSVSRGHEVSEAVQEALLAEGPHITDVVVHLEPKE